MISGKRIFITGGAGFIGSTIARALGQANQLTLFDNLTRNTLQHERLHTDLQVELVTGDVLDYETLRARMVGHNIIIHAAAIAGIDSVIRDPVRTMEINMIGTANALRAAHQIGSVERFLEFSTSEVFGSQAYRVDEFSNTTMKSAGEARWVYAVSKLAGEHLASAYYSQFGLPTTTLRPFNIYGPGQTGEGALQRFVCQALMGEPIKIHGDGTQIRAWCYVDDFVNGIMMALAEARSVGHSFNLGNSRAVTTIFGLAETICRVLGSKSKIEFVEPLSADIELRIPETKKAYDILGFRAEVDLEEGIRRTAAWIEKHYLGTLLLKKSISPNSTSFTQAEVI